MSDFLTVLVPPLQAVLPGGESVNPNENAVARDLERLESSVPRTTRPLHWNTVLEELSGIDTQLREIQLNFQESESFLRDNAFSAMVENTEKAIQGLNQEISELLLQNSRARELFLRNGSESVRWTSRSLPKSRSQWA